MAWDFSTDPEFQEQLDWMDTFVREEVRTARPVVGRPGLPSARPRTAGHRRPAQAAGAGPRAVGLPSRAGARGPGVRAGEAGADERDPGALAVGLGRVRHPGPRHGQRRDHRPLRHRCPEEGLSGAAPVRGAVLRLLDDRAPGWLRPLAVRDQGDPGRRRMGHRGLEVLHLQRPHGRLPHRHGRDRPGGRRLPGHVDVPGPDGHARCPDRAQHRADGRAGPRQRIARPHPLRPGAGARREPARGGGPGLRHRPDPVGRRAGPPRHADRGDGLQVARHAVRAGGEPPDP